MPEYNVILAVNIHESHLKLRDALVKSIPSLSVHFFSLLKFNSKTIKLQREKKPMLLPCVHRLLQERQLAEDRDSCSVDTTAYGSSSRYSLWFCDLVIFFKKVIYFFYFKLIFLYIFKLFS